MYVGLPDGSQPEAVLRAGTLWYDHPAERWFEALPIGNGRLGGMVYGGVGTERIELTEATAWSGAPASDDVSPTARETIPRVRELLFAGRHAQAQKLAAEQLLGRMSSFGTNVPLPQVRLDFAEGPPTTGYRRSLDLDQGLAAVEFEQGGTQFAREVFASNPHGVIAVRLTADRGEALSFAVRLDRVALPGQVTATADGLAFSGHAFETLHSNGQQGVALEIHVRVQTVGGSGSPAGDRYEVRDADSAVILIAVGTSWDGLERAESLLRRAPAYDVLRAEHVRDHSALMQRVSIDLGESSSGPTDVRRDRFAHGQRDDGLLALYFQYGRYLTVAGSRADSPLPLHLQGLWNDGLASSSGWTNDFHLDINTEQNYWAAESTNLAECHTPLFAFVRRLAEAGRETAEQMYGAQGWVAHTVTNAWTYTAPGSGAGWGLHVMAGAWIASHLWEHYEYSLDETFLREQAYPVIRGAAAFLLDYLVEEPDNGWLVAGPADSPENWYVAPDGFTCSVAMGNTVDRVFAEATLRACGEAAAVLDVDPELRERISSARSRLSPFQIGEFGQLQEWLHDYEEAEPSHRHTSHLCALYPERQITPRGTPELARASEITIERRQDADGWEQTEWVEANFALFYARLLNGDQALHHLTSLIAEASDANLMSYSVGGIAGAPQNIYSFDGNTGGTAAIAEMLLQSDGTEIELLPALPTTWHNGSIQGLRARGGLTVDLTWRSGRLTQAILRPNRTASYTIRYGDETANVDLVAGEPTAVRPGKIQS
ncbi:glycoside hydrolase family 95 protein [Kribbella sp. NPDC055071]